MGAGLLTRRRVAWVAAIVVLATAAAGPAVWWSRADGADRATGMPAPVATAEIVRTDMSTVESLPGRLGYGTAATVKGRGSGTVTWLPQPGASVRRGKQLYRVDDEPVPLFYGALPLYRPLDEPGMIGRDVRVLARNLAALGYAVGDQPGTGERVTPPGAGKATRVTVGAGEDVLTKGLTRAIKRWQEDLGRPVTGTVQPADVVVLRAAVRIDSVTAAVGDEVAAPLLQVTPTTKVITLAVGPDEAGAVRRGDRVSVLLPGEKTTPATVTRVGTEAKAPDAETGDPGGPPKLVVTVTLDNPKAAAQLDAAEVQVQFAAETLEGVLAVPVGALVALSEGGYAVQPAGGGLVAVRIGMFAKGLVQVTGDGLAEGDAVVTTS